MDNISLVVDEYYKGFFFLFLPNMCNARCSFCYVHPTYLKQGRISNSSLSGLDKLFRQLDRLGFETVRITGGEPSIFDNLDQLIKKINNYNFNYTVLTNSFDNLNLLKALAVKPPKKITISFHSIVNYKKIFGVNKNPLKTIEYIKDYVASGLSVAVTLMFLKENMNELKDLIDFFFQLSVEEIKIIYPNIYKLQLKLKDDYNDLISKLDNYAKFKTKIRYTDLNEKKCLLKKRGFLSITLPDFNITDCCINVGNKDNIQLKTDFSNLSTLLRGFYFKRNNISNFPCESFICSCPLALKNFSYA